MQSLRSKISAIVFVLNLRNESGVAFHVVSDHFEPPVGQTHLVHAFNATRIRISGLLSVSDKDSVRIGVGLVHPDVEIILNFERI